MLLFFKRKKIIIYFLALICIVLMLCCTIIRNNQTPVHAETVTEEVNAPSIHADNHSAHGTPLTTSTTVLSTGNYYLAGDLAMTTEITLQRGAIVNLCLNGYMLSSSATRAINYIGGTLNLYDCGGDGNQKHYYTKDPSTGRYIFGEGEDYISGGVITCPDNGVFSDGSAAIFNMYGGTVAGCQQGVVVANSINAICNMYGGKICGCSGFGMGLHNFANANLYGGEITDNTNIARRGNGAGLYIFNATTDAINVTVQGDVKIYDNYNASGAVTNLSLLGEGKLTVGSEGFSDNATIGITLPSGQIYEDGDFLINNSNRSIDDLLENYFFDDTGAHIHSYDTLVAKRDATCTQDGLEAHYQCSVCGKYADENENIVEYDSLVIPALGHDWGEGTVIPTTCITDGYTQYTCANCGETKKENVTSALGHNYSVTWEWSEDYSSATASYSCANCGDGGTVPVTPTKQQTNATCTTDGSVVYTATLSIDGKTFTDTKTETISSTGHDYQNTGWEWSTDYSRASLKFTCSICGDIDSHTAVITYVDNTETLIRTYTATVTVEGVQYTDTKTESLPEPDEPEEPEEPDNPDNPDNPDVPDNPDTPDIPDNPDNPDTPDTPDVPDTPDLPDIPDTPDNPDIPDNPDTPDEPDIPDTPDNPEVPDIPDTPDNPDNGSGCNGGIDWLLIICIGFILFDVVMFAITMRVICSKPKDDDNYDEEEDDQDDSEDEFID